MKKTGSVPLAGQHPLETSASELLEPAFHLAECRTLQIDGERWGEKAADFLARGVARRPVNLIAQIQRLNLYLAKRDAEGAYGALLDLFITLGEKGLLIRRRMLLRAKPLLTDEQFQALAMRLDTGVSASDPMPPSSSSVLSKGLTGIRELVVRIDEEGENRQRDPLDEAIEHLEYSQIDKAREVLEKAVLENPGRKDLQNNLLAIYRASNDRESFTTMHDKLRELGTGISDEWKKLAEYFSRHSAL